MDLNNLRHFSMIYDIVQETVPFVKWKVKYKMKYKDKLWIRYAECATIGENAVSADGMEKKWIVRVYRDVSLLFWQAN